MSSGNQASSIPRPTGITVLYGDTLSTVDIICIHGLNSGPERCWASGNVLWIKDLLPQTLGLENTRIATFGFNSNVFDGPSTARIRDHAMNLLQDLSDERRNEEAQERPIIFICHSLGGIVVKQALVFANQYSRFEAIKKATFGIVFLGTPHRGSESASLGKIMARLTKLAFQDPKTQLLKTLQENSQELQDLSEDFSNLHSQLRIISFFEQKETVFGKGLFSKSKLVVPKKSATLGITGEIQLSMNTNHHDICKFSGISDPGYIRVRNRILELVEQSGRSSRPAPQAPALRVGGSLPQDINCEYGNAYATDFPLRIAYGLYQKCAVIFRNIRNQARHLERHLEKCRIKLSSQAALFTHIFHLILIRHIGEDVVVAMLEDLDHSQWKNPTVQEALRMTDSAFDSSLNVARETLESIESRLSKLFTRVGQSVSQNPSLPGTGDGTDIVFSEKGALLELIQKLKIQNQELRCFQRERHPVRDSGARPQEKTVTPLDSKVSLKQLLNIREVAKVVYDGLAVTASCLCHCLNLQLQSLLDEPELEVGTNQTERFTVSSRSKSAIKFRLMVTEGTGAEDRDIGCHSEIRFECTCITINSERQSAVPKVVMAGVKRPGPAYTEPGNKKARYADGYHFETSSTQAIVMVSDGGEERARNIVSINIGPGRKKIKLEIEREEYRNEISPEIIGTSISACETKSIEYDTNAPDSRLTTTNNVPEVDNLCSLLASTKLRTGEQTKQLLGRIPHNEPNPSYQHLIYREPLHPHSASRMSLDWILEQPFKKSLLTHSERLKMAIVLSLSLLHFGSYSSSWFQERWRSRDIFFFPEHQKMREHRMTLTPYVVPSFPTSAKIMSTDGTPKEKVRVRGLARNEQLFSLTLVLIEIGCGDTLFNIPETAKIPGKRDDSYAEYMKVQKILDEGVLAEQMGSTYAAVVRRCFYCDFALEFGEDGVDLSKGEMQEIFYRKVVCELEHCLKKFQGF